MNETTSIKKFYEDGLQFECTRCSNCCRHAPGSVFLSENDLEKIQKTTGLSRPRVLDIYCRRVDAGITVRISIKERANYDCIFWSDAGCGIYAHRPIQCRSYPFWSAIVASKESWEQEGKCCPGINRGKTHSRKTVDKWLVKRGLSYYFNIGDNVGR